MKTGTIRNASLALLGLVAWVVCILACTSFSPDDKKVLYPSFDPASGTVGVAVYDRETKQSEMLFVPFGYEANDTNAATLKPVLMRSQWLPDGKTIVIAWPEDEKGGTGKALNLAVTSWGVRAPLKLFYLPGIKEAASRLVTPLTIVDSRLLIMSSEKTLLHLDLNTGMLGEHEFADAKGEITLYPAPAGNAVFYVEEPKSEEGQTFGRLDPKTFARTPMIVITNNLKNLLAYNQDGSRIALLEDAENDQTSFIVVEKGKVTFSRLFGAKKEKVDFGGGAFSPNGNMVLANFARRIEGQTNASYGLMEFPIGNGAIRETMLISSVPAETHGDEEAFYFQAGISHDGKTAAASSAYLALAKEGFKPEDCALFFVDLSDPKRKVTKVPIAMPANRPGLK
jgi:hypothetical protein